MLAGSQHFRHMWVSPDCTPPHGSAGRRRRSFASMVDQSTLVQGPFQLGNGEAPTSNLGIGLATQGKGRITQLLGARQR